MNTQHHGGSSRGRDSDPHSHDTMRCSLEQKFAATGDERHEPPPIPDHVLLRRIGSGAYGDVWLARSTLGTLRAVKIVYRARFEEDHPYEREFKGIVNYEPISRSHEGLVQVLHVGRNDEAGCFYYVMERADDAGGEPRSKCPDPKAGSDRQIRPAPSDVALRSSESAYVPRTLRCEIVRSQRLPPRDAAQLVLRLASALGHLHAQGLVHRDIKPSNIIFVGGQPKLADIGLVTGAGSSHTFVGTEGFVPPEGPGTQQADLFALGKLLYELATGRNRMEFPQLPPQADQLPHGDALLELNEVMTRACAPDLKFRYASTTEFQADLNLFLAGHSLRRARTVERHLARTRKFAMGASGFLVLAVGLVWLAKNEEHRAKERVLEAAKHSLTETTLRRRAQAAEHATQQQLYTALLEQARATVLSGELGQRVRALDAIRRASAISNSTALRGVALAAYALPDLKFERELPYGSQFTLRLVDSSFERIAVCRGRGAVQIRSTSDDRLLATLPASTNLPAHYAEWSPDGRFLAVKRDWNSRGTRADKEVWSVADARLLLLLRDVPFNAMSFHPRLPELLVGEPGALAIWDLEQHSRAIRIRLEGTPQWLRFSPDGKAVAATYPVGRDWVVSVHRISTGQRIASTVFNKLVASFNWHPSGRWLAVADYSGTVHWMDALTGESQPLGHHKAEATRVEFSPDGDYLISGGWDRELICWDARTLRRAFTAGLDGYVGRFRSDGQMYALETENSVQFYEFKRADGHHEFSEDLGALLRYAAFSPDNRWLAAAGRHAVGVWDLHQGGSGALATNAWTTRVNFAADGDLFADRPGACFHWRVLPGTNAGAPPKLLPLKVALPEHFRSLCTVSNTVVLTTTRGSAVIEDARTEFPPGVWTKTVAGYNGVSSDGRWLAIFASFTPYLSIHRLPGLERVAILTNLSNIRSFQFSPAGDELAVACRLGVEFWSTATWLRTRSMTNYNNQLYSADGRTMWLTREFRAGGLHNARTGALLMTLPIGTYPLAVSPDGRQLAVSVNLRRLQVWDLEEMRTQLRNLGLDWGDAGQLVGN